MDEKDMYTVVNMHTGVIGYLKRTEKIYNNEKKNN